MPVYALTIQIVTTLLLTIRLISRVNGTGGRFGFDDVFITIAWAIATVNIGLIIKCMHHLHLPHKFLLTAHLVSYSFGLDRHIWDVLPANWSIGAKVN